jgi:hypothetical protein
MSTPQQVTAWGVVSRLSRSRGDGSSVLQTILAINPAKHQHRLTHERLWGLATRCHKMPSSRALTTPVNPHRGWSNPGLLSNESPSNGRGTLSTRWLPATGKRGKYAERKGNPAIKLRVTNQI